MNKNQFFCAVPEGQDWPIIGRDEKTGRLILRPGFVEAVETASNLTPGQLSEQNLSQLLVGWYFERLKAGFARDQFLDELIENEIGYLPTTNQDGGGHG